MRTKKRPQQPSTKKKEPCGKEKIQAYTLATDGRGIGKGADGSIVFAKNLLPSETAEVILTEKKANYKSGVSGTPESPSPLRQTPPCVYFAKCGGCQIQHIQEEAQTQFKIQWFFETLKRLGKWRSEYIHVAQSQLGVVYLRKTHYRRRIRLHFDGKRLGFYNENSHDIIDIEHCLIASKRINARLLKLREQLRQGLKGVTLKSGYEIELTESEDEKVILHLIQKPLATPSPEEAKESALLNKLLDIQSDQLILLNHPELGKFKITKQSFVQPHSNCLFSYHGGITQAVTKFLQRQKIFTAKDTWTSWDLFAGSGYFTSIPYFVGKTLGLNFISVGVDGVPEAIHALNQNHKNTPIEGIAKDVFEFVEEQFHKRLQGDNALQLDVLILDPPRSGVGVNTMQKLVELCQKNSLILYLACDAASFARDCQILLEGGFQLQDLSLFDSFGHTTHYEVLGCFERRT